MVLGNKLKKSLQQIDGDEVVAWMAHYLAEKMVVAESANHETSIQAKRECFETILLLWEYRVHFPDNARPFHNLTAIFNVLSQLDPQNSSPYYFRYKDPNHSPSTEVDQILNAITNLDKAARTIISFYIRESMLQATNDSVLEWLSTIEGLVNSDEFNILIKLIPELNDKEIDLNENRKKELSEQIKRLEVFEELSKDVKYALKSELKKLDKKN